MGFAGARIALHQQAGSQKFLKVQSSRSACRRVAHLDRNGHVSTQSPLGGGGLNNLIAARRALMAGYFRVLHGSSNAISPDGCQPTSTNAPGWTRRPRTSQDRAVLSKDGSRFLAAFKVRVHPTGLVVHRLKDAVGLAIVAVFGWLPLRAIWQTSSVEAVVNARLVTLRSPIDGRVSAKPGHPTASSVVNEGEVILRVVNARGDRARLDDLRRQMSRLENERPSLAAKLASAEAAQQDLAR